MGGRLVQSISQRASEFSTTGHGFIPLGFCGSRVGAPNGAPWWRIGPQIRFNH